jgi:copper oxidase (laccase) domain-containing protein
MLPGEGGEGWRFELADSIVSREFEVEEARLDAIDNLLVLLGNAIGLCSFEFDAEGV